MNTNYTNSSLVWHLNRSIETIEARGPVVKTLLHYEEIINLASKNVREDLGTTGTGSELLRAMTLTRFSKVDAVHWLKSLVGQLERIIEKEGKARAARRAVRTAKIDSILKSLKAGDVISCQDHTGLVVVEVLDTKEVLVRVTNDDIFAYEINEEFKIRYQSDLLDITKEDDTEASPEARPEAAIIEVIETLKTELSTILSKIKDGAAIWGTLEARKETIEEAGATYCDILCMSFATGPAAALLSVISTQIYTRINSKCQLERLIHLLDLSIEAVNKSQATSPESNVDALKSDLLNLHDEIKSGARCDLVEEILKRKKGSIEAAHALTHDPRYDSPSEALLSVIDGRFITQWDALEHLKNLRELLTTNQPTKTSIL